MSTIVNRILYQDHREEGFSKKAHTFLSKFSNVQVWEANRAQFQCKQMNDEQFVEYLSNDRPLIPDECKFRAILIPGCLEDTDRLQLTEPSFTRMLDKYRISPRLPGMLRFQMGPSRMIEYDSVTQNPTAIEFIYSAIVRSLRSADASTNDPTKRVLNQRRIYVWTRRDMRSGATTLVVLRCPERARSRFLSALGQDLEGRRELLRHPMLVHAMLAEYLVLRSNEFSMDFAAPLYGMELDFGNTTGDFTERGRRFLTMARQIGQVSVDYDIYLAAIDLLEEVFAWIRDQGPPADVTAAEWRLAHLEFDGRSLATVRREFELRRRYAALYEERLKIGNAESTALVNQSDAEISKHMSAESTTIARAAHRDGRSLRIIQYLGLIFLPLSLCTGVFGMGFFSADKADSGLVNVLVADTWWWFLALGLPFTLVVLGITYFMSWYSRGVDDNESMTVRMEDLERLYTMKSNGRRGS